MSTLRNTPTQYGRVAKWLHWLMAIMVLISFASIYYRGYFTEPRTDPSTLALQIHMSTGFYLFALVILRFLWKLSNITPAAIPGPTWQQQAAKWNHRIFYFLLFAMPITGWIFAGLTNEFFYNTPFAFELVPKFTDTQLFQVVVGEWFGITPQEWRDARTPFKNFHVITGTYIFLTLVIVHIAAAFYHHFALRDDTLKRMAR